MKQALVIVAKAPVAGHVKTRLIPTLGPRRAARLYTCFLLDSVARVDTLPDTDAIVVYPPRRGTRSRLQALLPAGCRLLPQEGTGLGEAFSYTFRLLLAPSGEYGRVVLINSDSPSLPQSQIRESFEALDRADLVFGPSEDGGYNLIAMSRPHVGVFERITWSTNVVGQQTLDRAAELGLSVHILPPWYDVDTGPELMRLAADLMADPDHPAANTRRQLVEWQRAGIFPPRQVRTEDRGRRTD